jgi:hypothetical protein
MYVDLSEPGESPKRTASAAISRSPWTCGSLQSELPDMVDLPVKCRAGPNAPSRSRDELGLQGMEFFCYHRDRPGSAALRDDLREEHWSYMDRYAEAMRAVSSETRRPVKPRPRRSAR